MLAKGKKRGRTSTSRPGVDEIAEISPWWILERGPPAGVVAADVSRAKFLSTYYRNKPPDYYLELVGVIQYNIHVRNEKV